MKRRRRYQHRLLDTATGPRIVDFARGKPLVPGPEEFVRQDVLRSLIEIYGYPVSSLLAEEPTARERGERRRADVLVELPQDVAPRHRTVLEDAEESSRPDYCSVATMVAERVRGIPGVRLVAVPDRLSFSVDGRIAEMNVGGFVGMRGAIGIRLWPDPEQVGQLGLPLVVDLPVLGLGLAPAELAIAQSFGLPSVRFDSEANCAFTRRAARLLEPLGLSHPFQEELHFHQGIGMGISRDGRAGFWIIREHPGARGVLAHCEFGDEGVVGRPAVEPPTVRSRRDYWRWAAHLDAPTRTLIVVECKSPAVSFSEEVLRQGLRYAEDRHAQYLVVTNGSTWTRTFSVGLGQPIEIDEIPTYVEAVGSAQFKVRRVPPFTPHARLPVNAQARSDLVRIHARARDCIGSDVPEEFWPALLRFDDALKGPRLDIHEPLQQLGLTFVEDLGMRWHEPTHTAGRLPARFRDVVVKGGDGRERSVSLTLMALRAVRNHPRWKNQAAGSRLMACTPHQASLRSEIEIDPARWLEGEGRAFNIVHNGQAAKGGGGQYACSDVVRFVRARCPTLVDGGSVVRLGTLGVSVQRDMDVLARLAAYAVVRADFKDQAAARE